MKDKKKRMTLGYIWGVTDPSSVWGGKEPSEKVRKVAFILGIIFTVITALSHFFIPAMAAVHPVFVGLSLLCWVVNFCIFTVRYDVKEAGIVALVILAIIFILT